MKDHPLTPTRDSNLMRLLEPQISRPAGLAEHLWGAKGPVALGPERDRLQSDGVVDVIVDASASRMERPGIIRRARRMLGFWSRRPEPALGDLTPGNLAVSTPPDP